MNKNTCENCHQKIPKSKRRDAIYCNHTCRMVQANLRNQGVRHVLNTIAVMPAEPKTVNDIKAVSNQIWKHWMPETDQPYDVAKPKFRQTDLLTILEELHSGLA